MMNVQENICKKKVVHKTKCMLFSDCNSAWHSLTLQRKKNDVMTYLCFKNNYCLCSLMTEVYNKVENMFWIPWVVI